MIELTSFDLLRLQRLHSAFDYEVPFRATIFWWFREFPRAHSLIEDEAYTERSASVTLENVIRVRHVTM